MGATLNTFPSLNELNGRSWTLVAIIALHVGFFFVLSSGVRMPIIHDVTGPIRVLPRVTPAPEPRPIDHTVVDELTPVIKVVEPVAPALEPDETSGPREEHMPGPAVHHTGVQPGQGEGTAIVVEPQIGSRGLSEPMYPASEIRANHTGTVLLSVQVLENGRVGAVRIDQSSGYPKLDASAAREAARWRLRPGMRDGVPVAMWKQIPITFRLQQGQKF